jgi:hypothetical protein
MDLTAHTDFETGSLWCTAFLRSRFGSGQGLPTDRLACHAVRRRAILNVGEHDLAGIGG